MRGKGGGEEGDKTILWEDGRKEKEKNYPEEGWWRREENYPVNF